MFKGKRIINLTDEDDLDFFKHYCRQFFGKLEDPMELDEDLLEEIWEEIKLAGTLLGSQFYFIVPMQESLFGSIDVEASEARMLDHLLEGSLNHQTICPICLKLPLTRSHHYILCGCGFKFYLPEPLTLQDFETALLVSNDFHGETCSSIPQYHTRLAENNKQQLVSTCETCEMVNIIFENDNI